jgi:hypothetical protein
MRPSGPVVSPQIGADDFGRVVERSERARDPAVFFRFADFDHRRPERVRSFVAANASNLTEECRIAQNGDDPPAGVLRTPGRLDRGGPGGDRAEVAVGAKNRRQSRRKDR